MNVIEQSAEGLRRELKVVVDAQELERRLSDRLDELKGRVKLKGFRPGHVPKDHLRKVYGRSVMAEVVQQAVAETSREAISQRQERPAFQPDIKLPEDETEIERVISGNSDLAYTMSFEVLPKIDITDLSQLELERPVVEVTDADMAKALDRIAKANVRYKPKDGPAADGDRVLLDYVGSIDGKDFEGGVGEDAPIVLGGGGFIPGFEEGLKGIKAGEERTIEATFPDNYPQPDLAGKAASFRVTAKEIGAPQTPALDDEFAQSLGVENMEKLREALKQRLAQDFGQATRLRLKRALLDALNEKHQFDLPPTLVENEFQSIWQQVTGDLGRTGRTFEDEGTTEDKAKAEYREIAERRVRLGLVLSEIGQSNQIQVSDEEVNRALLERIRQFPGQERQLYDYYRKNPQALAEIRAPVFEDKVVDFIVELAKVTDKPISSEDLFADEEHEHHGHSHGHDHGHHHGHSHG
jgi:trigger factor